MSLDSKFHLRQDRDKTEKRQNVIQDQEYEYLKSQDQDSCPSLMQPNDHLLHRARFDI